MCIRDRTWSNYADDVAVLAEMLDFLVAGLLVLQEEAALLRLQIYWIKTKIQQIWVACLTQSTAQVAAENTELVNDFVYLSSLISHVGGSEATILQCIMITRNCLSLLDKNIWKSYIHTTLSCAFTGYIFYQFYFMVARHEPSLRL